MIQLRDIYKSFGGTPVIKGATLDVKEGETLAVIGRSGSGKSVLMKHMIGLLKPDSGYVLVDGVDINKLAYHELQKLRRNFGVLFQGGALFDSMNSFDNVAFPLRTFSKKSEAEIKRDVLECLDMVELPDVGPKFPPELSGGMQKRVALARAIAMRPRYIMYDEPTSGLDPETSNVIDQMIKSLAVRLNVTSVVVTHDMHSVLTTADRVAFINEGRIWWVGSIPDLHVCADDTLINFVRANEYQIGAAGNRPQQSVVPRQTN